MKKLKAKTVADFILGGGGYCLTELLYRGYTHPSMFAAGGVSYLMLKRIARTKINPAAKALCAGAAITGVELAAGCVVNLWLKKGVWDYSDKKGNFLGQICPQFTLAWCLLGGAVTFAHSRVQMKKVRH